MQQIDPESGYVTYTEVDQIPKESTVSPPIVQSFRSSVQEIYLAATDAEQGGQTYLVYIYGELDYYDSDQVFKEKMKQMMTPFEVTVIEPYTSDQNTIPDVATTYNGETVTAITLKPGQEAVVQFDKPLDFENNKVSYVLDSFKVEGELFDKYQGMVTLYPPEKVITNNTLVEEMQLKIVIDPKTKPKNTMNTQESFVVALDFIDDHATDPQTTEYFLTVVVEFEIVEAEEFTFDSKLYEKS